MAIGMVVVVVVAGRGKRGKTLLDVAVMVIAVIMGSNGNIRCSGNRGSGCHGKSSRRSGSHGASGRSGNRGSNGRRGTYGRTGSHGCYASC
eukprot:311850-Alexandrium_andersonii.AAC.1